MDMLTPPEEAKGEEITRAAPRERGNTKRGRKSNAEKARIAAAKKKSSAKAAPKPGAASDGAPQFTPPGEDASFEAPKAPREKAKPRGRRSADPDSVKIFANMLGGVYFAIAGMTQTPEWMLSEPEALDYANDICTALEYFDFELDPKTMAITAAVMKSIRVNAPRLQATAMRARARRQAGQPGTAGQSGGPNRQAAPRASQGPQGQGGQNESQEAAQAHDVALDPAEMARAAMMAEEPPPPQTNLYGAPANNEPGVPD